MRRSRRSHIWPQRSFRRSPLFLYVQIVNGANDTGTRRPGWRLACSLGAGWGRTLLIGSVLLNAANGSLSAQRFDADTLQPSGEPVTLADGLITNANEGGLFSATESVLAHRKQIAAAATQLTWVDRAGTTLGTVGDPADQMALALSPDGARAAVSVFDAVRVTRDLWVYSTESWCESAVHLRRGRRVRSSWSPDGHQLLSSAVPLRPTARSLRAAAGLFRFRAAGRLNARFNQPLCAVLVR